MKAADRLAVIRAKIKVLAAEEAELRAGFASGDLDPVGDDHIVLVDTKVNQRIDLRAMRQHVDAAIWSPFLIATPTTYVRTERKTGDEANKRDDLKTSRGMHT